MNRQSIDIILLLSNVYTMKQLTAFAKDMKALSAGQLKVVLDSAEAQKTVATTVVAKELEALLEEKTKLAGTVDEISYLLLTRYSLKPAAAVEGLSRAVRPKAEDLDVPARLTKKTFIDWLGNLCERVPRDALMSAALSLRPESLP